MNVRKTNKGWTLIETLIGVAVSGGMAAWIASAYVAVANGDITIPPKLVEYVICKDSDGVIHQASGYNITIENTTVVVHNSEQPDKMFVNMDCWTEDETVHAPDELTEKSDGR